MLFTKTSSIIFINLSCGIAGHKAAHFPNNLHAHHSNTPSSKFVMSNVERHFVATPPYIPPHNVMIEVPIDNNKDFNLR
ncbi:unnamed protein product [Gordionus sp. m RMFG-2023]